MPMWPHKEFAFQMSWPVCKRAARELFVRNRELCVLPWLGSRQGAGMLARTSTKTQISGGKTGHSGELASLASENLKVEDGIELVDSEI